MNLNGLLEKNTATLIHQLVHHHMKRGIIIYERQTEQIKQLVNMLVYSKK